MSSTIRDLLSAAQKALQKVGIEGAAREARILVAEATGIPRDRITLAMADRVDRQAAMRLDDLLMDRLQRKPLSHVLGGRHFFDHYFHITPEVLDPRPETEVLVREALSGQISRVLDLGVGSGAILISVLAARPAARGTGTDLSDAALRIARANAERIGVADRCEFRNSDWFQGVGDRFDLIVSNPPYIAADEMPGLAPELSFEPRMALTDEGDGLSAYRAICAGARDHLTPGGRLLVEIGATQAGVVSELFRQAGLGNLRVVQDLDGRDRVVVGDNPA